MAVTSVSQKYGRRYVRNADQTAQATRIYCVRTDSDYNDLTDLLRDAVTAGLPAMGTAFGVESYETELFVVRHTPLEIANEKRMFDIQVDYETSIINFDGNDGWTISFSSIFEEYVPYRTKFNSGATGITLGANERAVLSGKSIINTAGDKFDPPVVDVRTKTRITFTKTLDEITDIGTISNIKDLMDRVNSVNDAAITIAGIAGEKTQFLIEDIQVTKRDEGAADYYDVTIQIIYDPNYHILRVLNTGFQDINRQKATDKRGQPLPNAQLLDNNGNFIVANKNANAIYLAFGVKEYTTFGDLSLPTTF